MQLSDRAKKLIGMLSSTADGERATAAKLLCEELARTGLTIHDLAAADVGTKAKPTYKSTGPASSEHLEEVFIWWRLEQIRDDKNSVLTRWERQFVIDMLNRFDTYGQETYLSEKQTKIVRRIIEKNGGTD